MLHRRRIQLQLQLSHHPRPCSRSAPASLPSDPTVGLLLASLSGATVTKIATCARRWPNHGPRLDGVQEVRARCSHLANAKAGPPRPSSTRYDKAMSALLLVLTRSADGGCYLASTSRVYAPRKDVLSESHPRRRRRVTARSIIPTSAVAPGFTLLHAWTSGVRAVSAEHYCASDLLPLALVSGTHRRGDDLAIAWTPAPQIRRRVHSISIGTFPNRPNHRG